MRAGADSADERLAKLLELHELLAGVSRRLGPALALEPVLTTVLEAMRSLVDFRGGTITLVDDEGCLRVAASDPPVSPDVAAARLPVGQGLSGRAVATAAPVYSPDVHDDPRADPVLCSLGSNRGMASYLAVPLICLGEVIGVLQVDSTEVDAFDESDLQVLQGLATQVAGAVESARRHEEVVELERLKSDFIARASHELRTPLTVVCGFTETLLGLWPRLADDERTAILMRMQGATERLHRLVDELVTVAGFEAGVITPRPDDVRVAPVVEHLREDTGRAESIEVDCPPELTVRTDPKLLSHAVRLLLDNALKFAGHAAVVATVDADRGEVVVAVVDHGPGVPPGLRGRIFERFTRGDDSSPGMGLGLPLVRLLASGCGARVEMQHPEDGGVVVGLRFPDSVLAAPFDSRTSEGAARSEDS